MVRSVFGAFTLLIVVNGQDVQVTCSVCGLIRDATVDRSQATDAAGRMHIESHIRSISSTGEAHIAGWRVRHAAEDV
jgi:hypothetical protein